MSEDYIKSLESMLSNREISFSKDDFLSFINKGFKSSLLSNQRKILSLFNGLYIDNSVKENNVISFFEALEVKFPNIISSSLDARGVDSTSFSSLNEFRLLSNFKDIFENGLIMEDGVLPLGVAALINSKISSVYNPFSLLNFLHSNGVSLFGEGEIIFDKNNDFDEDDEEEFLDGKMGIAHLIYGKSLKCAEFLKPLITENDKDSFKSFFTLSTPNFFRTKSHLNEMINLFEAVPLTWKEEVAIQSINNKQTFFKMEFFAECVGFEKLFEISPKVSPWFFLNSNDSKNNFRSLAIEKIDKEERWSSIKHLSDLNLNKKSFTREVYDVNNWEKVFPKYAEKFPLESEDLHGVLNYHSKTSWYKKRLNGIFANEAVKKFNFNPFFHVGLTEVIESLIDKNDFYLNKSQRFNQDGESALTALLINSLHSEGTTFFKNLLRYPNLEEIIKSADPDEHFNGYQLGEIFSYYGGEKYSHLSKPVSDLNKIRLALFTTPSVRKIKFESLNLDSIKLKDNEIYQLWKTIISGHSPRFTKVIDNNPMFISKEEDHILLLSKLLKMGEPNINDEVESYFIDLVGKSSSNSKERNSHINQLILCKISDCGGSIEHIASGLLGSSERRYFNTSVFSEVQDEKHMDLHYGFFEKLSVDKKMECFSIVLTSLNKLECEPAKKIGIISDILWSWKHKEMIDFFEMASSESVASLVNEQFYKLDELANNSHRNLIISAPKILEKYKEFSRYINNINVENKLVESVKANNHNKFQSGPRF